MVTRKNNGLWTKVRRPLVMIEFRNRINVSRTAFRDVHHADRTSSVLSCENLASRNRRHAWPETTLRRN
jgi:hypothetical protein